MLIKKGANKTGRMSRVLIGVKDLGTGLVSPVANNSAYNYICHNREWSLLQMNLSIR